MSVTEQYTNFVLFIKSLYFLVRYGRISEKVEDSLEAWGSPCTSEKSYWARGKCVGYWAYGYFEHCPESIYYGQKLHRWCYEKQRFHSH